MADYAIGLSFHKANRTIVRAVQLKPPCRYFATRDGAGFITLPTLDPGDQYVEVQGVSQTSFQINDTNQEFRLLGDDGWMDSLITGSSVQASCTAYFLKDAEIPTGAQCPQFRGDYDEGFALIERARYDKDFEIYVEFLKEMGQSQGDSGDWIYDFTGFNAVIQNYNESLNAEGLTEITFDMMSRARPIFGRYNAGPARLAFGAVQSTLLFLETGVREVDVTPTDNASAVAVGSDVTLTYTNGSVALTDLALGQTDGSGFSLVAASSGVKVPATVTLATNVVTISPSADLAAGTVYQVIAADGAITQGVGGFRQPLQGIRTSFVTA